MYEIPQELKYKEKIIFNLEFEQLIYSSLAIFFGLLILKTSLDLNLKITLLMFIGCIAIFFMYFNLKSILFNYISWLISLKLNFMTYSMNKYLSFKSIENDSIIIKKSRIKLISKLSKLLKIKSKNSDKIAIIKVMPINFSIKHNDDQELIIKNFQKFLNSLDFEVQILIKSHPLNINNYFNSIKNNINKSYRVYYKQYQQLIQENIDSKSINDKSFYLVIKEANNLEIQCNLCIERLRLMNIKSSRLKDQELLNLLKGFFNYDHEREYSNDVSKNNYLNYLIAPNSIINKSNHLIIDKVYYRIIASHGYPRSVNHGFLDKIISSNGNFDVSMHIEPMSIESTIVYVNKELQKQRADLYSLSQNKIYNSSLKLKYKDTKEILNELHKGSQKLFNVSLYVMVKANNLEDLDFLTKKLESELNSLLIIPKITNYEMLKSLKSIMPYSKDLLKYKRNITTEALSAFFPFTSKFLDIDDNGILLGLNKNNIPIIKDIYSLGNSNGFILASSGFGKSFFAKLLIIRRLLLKTKVFVIDPQNEYTKLGMKFSAQIINISKDSKSIINPLDLMNHDYTEKRLSLMDLFNIMLGGISDSQKSILDRAITSCYSKKGITSSSDTWHRKPPILKDLLQELIDNESSAVFIEKTTYQSLINRVSMYVDGVFSFMNQQTKIDFSKDFIVFNLDSLPKQVKPVIMFLILDYLYMKMKNDKEKKLLVIDEAWSLLNKVEEASYIFEIVKTSRKYNLALLLITQDVVDLVDSKAGNAILSNSSYTVLLSQKPAVINSIAKTFNLSDYEKDLLITAKIGQGLVILDQEHSELNIISSKEEYDLITTNPNDVVNLKTSKIDIPKVSVNIDVTKRFYLKNSLTKDEIEFLLDSDYVISKCLVLGTNDYSEFLLKPDINETSSHFYLKYSISEYIKKFTAKVYNYNDVEVVFISSNNKRVALVIESKSKISKSYITARIDYLKKNFDDYFVLVSDVKYLDRYAKYCSAYNSVNVLEKINSYFVNKSVLDYSEK